MYKVFILIMFSNYLLFNVGCGIFGLNFSLIIVFLVHLKKNQPLFENSLKVKLQFKNFEKL